MRIERKSLFAADNQTWIGSATGTTDASTATLDGTKLGGFDRVIPSGIPLKEGAEGKYEPVTAAEDTLAGFLLAPQEVNGDEDIIAPLMWHGAVRVDRLPEEAFPVGDLATENPRFDLRKDV